jgi:hypothetical protein
MPPKNDLIPVKGFMTESRRNVEVATAVYNEYKGAREIIVKDFFTRVSKLLKRSKKFQSWETEYDGDFFNEEYSAYRLRKKSWREKYDIRIEAWRFGDRMIYGVWRDKEQLDRVNRSNALLQAIRQKLPGAKLKARDYYEAEITMDFPEPDWRQPKVLWRMVNDERFAMEVGALLSEIAEIAEEHVDKLMQ